MTLEDPRHGFSPVRVVASPSVCRGGANADAPCFQVGFSLSYVLNGGLKNHYENVPVWNIVCFTKCNASGVQK